MITTRRAREDLRAFLAEKAVKTLTRVQTKAHRRQLDHPSPSTQNLLRKASREVTQRKWSYFELGYIVMELIVRGNKSFMGGEETQWIFDYT